MKCKCFAIQIEIEIPQSFLSESVLTGYSKNILRLKCHTHDLSCIVSRVIFLLSNKYLNLLIFENYVFNLILLPLIFVSSFRVVRISLELYFL